MKISGVFKFYQNGELIGEAQNTMTEVGRVLAIKTLMGAIPNFGTSLAVGTDSTANPTPVNGLIPNTRLGFKVASAKVIATNIDTEPNFDVILYKGKINDSLYYRIYEVGLFSDPLSSGSSGYKDELVLAFEESDNLESGNVYLSDDNYNSSTIFFANTKNTTYGDKFRIGRRAVVINANSSSPQISTTNSFVGLDEYDDLDVVTLAFNCISSATVVVRFYTNESYKEYSFSGTAGYNVKSVNLAGAALPLVDSKSNPNFDWSNITKITIHKSSGGAVVLDGLKLEDVNLVDINRGLVSRATLPSNTPIVKLANIPVDIEYSLRIGFNGTN